MTVTRILLQGRTLRTVAWLSTSITGPGPRLVSLPRPCTSVTRATASPTQGYPRCFVKTGLGGERCRGAWRHRALSQGTGSGVTRGTWGGVTSCASVKVSTGEDNGLLPWRFAAGQKLCDCHPGYTLAADGHTCEDIDECQVEDGMHL